MNDFKNRFVLKNDVVHRRLTVPLCRLLCACLVLLMACCAWSQAILPQTPRPNWHSEGWLGAQTSFSHDGRSLLVWNARGFSVYSSGGTLLATENTSGPLTAACISSDGSKVFYSTEGSDYNNNGIIVFNVSTQTQIHFNEGGGSIVYTICCSQDGSTAAFYENQSGVPLCYVMNLSNGSETGFQLNSTVTTMSFAKQDQEIVIDGPNVYNLQGKQFGNSISGGPVAVSPDGMSLYAYSQQLGGIMGYSFGSVGLQPLWQSAQASAPTSVPAVSSDGLALFLASAGGGEWIIQGYSTATGSPLESSFVYPLSTAGSSDTPALALSPAQPMALLGPGIQNESSAVELTLSSSSGAGSSSHVLFEGATAQYTQQGYWPYYGFRFSNLYSVGNSSFSYFVSDDLHDGTNSNLTLLRNALGGSAALSVGLQGALFSPDTKYFLQLDSGNNLDVYATSSPLNPVATYTPQAYGITDFFWGPTDAQICIVENIGDNYPGFYMESFSGSKLTPGKSFSLNGTGAATGAYTGDGKYIVALASSPSSSAVAYNVSTGKLVATIMQESGSNGFVRVDPIANSSQIGLSEQIGSYSSKATNEYRIFDVSIAPPTRKTKIFGSMPNNTIFADGTVSPNGAYIALADASSPVSPETRNQTNFHLYSVASGTGQQINAVAPISLPTDGLNLHLCFSSDSSVLAYQSGGALYGFNLPPATLSLALTNVSNDAVLESSAFTGQLTLSSPAKAATYVVMNYPPQVTGPANVLFPSGATQSATFQMNALALTTTTTVAIGAADGFVTTQTPLTIDKNPISITLSPPTVTGKSTSTCTVSVADQVTSALTFTLASTSPYATLSTKTLTIPAGSSSASFTISTTNPPGNTTSGISATSSAYGATASALLTINQEAAAQFTFTPASVTGGSVAALTVSLLNPAPTGGTTFTLKTGGVTPGALSLPSPATVTVAAGKSSATVKVGTNPVATNTSATITATNGANSYTALAPLQVLAPVVTSLTPSVDTFYGSGNATMLVELNGPAPSGFTVTGSSSPSGLVTFTSPITFTAGKAYTTVNLQIAEVAIFTTVTITVGGQTCTLLLLPDF